MLIELGVMEQRHQAVLEVMRGACVSEVAVRYGVTRQTVHRSPAPLRTERHRRARERVDQAGELSPPDATRGRGAHR